MTRTYPRKWTLLRVALIALLASDSYPAGYGDGETPTVTYLSVGARKRLWQCPVCQRVEATLLSKPECSGTPESRHDATGAKPVSRRKIPALSPTDNRRLFRAAGR
jgi:hypothetical protein